MNGNLRTPATIIHDPECFAVEEPFYRGFYCFFSKFTLIDQCTIECDNLEHALTRLEYITSAKEYGIRIIKSKPLPSKYDYSPFQYSPVFLLSCMFRLQCSIFEKTKKSCVIE